MLSLLLLVSLAAPASPLAEAEAQYYQLNYRGTLEALTRVKTQRGLPRAVVLRLLELEGLTAAQLRLSGRAQEALRRLLVLDPERTFGSFAPKVNTQLLEARSWAKSQGPLTVTTAAPATRLGAVDSVGVTVTNDPLSLVVAVRFSVRSPGEPWQVVTVPVTQGSATVRTTRPVVEWWAEVLGPNDAVLVEVAAASQPNVVQAPAPEVVRAPEPPAEAPPARPLTAESLTTQPAPRSHAAKWVLLAVGAAAAGTGAGFGVSSASARLRLDRPVLDADGLVMGLTQSGANALHEQMQRDAWAANVLFGVGALLAVTAVVWFLFDHD